MRLETPMRNGTILLAGFLLLSAGPAGPGHAAGAAAAETGKAACGPATVTADVEFARETVVYDLGVRFVVVNKARTRQFSTYEVKRKIDLRSTAEGDCLRSVDVTVAAAPTIHLASDYANAEKFGFARATALDYEARYAPIARARHAALPALIRARVAAVLKENADTPKATTLKRISAALDARGPLFSAFQKTVEREREAFDAAQRANPNNVVRNCRYVTQERY